VRFPVLAIPTELAAGRYPAPAWVILALGGAVVAGAVLYLALRLRRTAPNPPDRRPR
jgi:hypothetical protein